MRLMVAALLFAICGNCFSSLKIDLLMVLKKWFFDGFLYGVFFKSEFCGY